MEIVKILIVEDTDADIEFIRYELAKSGIIFETQIAQNKTDYVLALQNFAPDIILSDYSLPGFEGPVAFGIKEMISPLTPFILVSGTVGDERAVELIKSGVTDYVLKDKLFTLIPKIIRALKEAAEKNERISVSVSLHKAKNLYAFSSQVNQDIIRVSDEKTLFRNSCRLAIEFGKFRIAWIGLFSFPGKIISLVEQSGLQEDDLHIFNKWVNGQAGPQDSILDTGNHFICNDIQSELTLESWKPFAASLNINSCMVLPIKMAGRVIGTFNLYSTELYFAGGDEIKLLIEVANDISFALDLFEKDKKHAITEELVIQSAKRFRALVENGTDAVAIFSEAGDIEYISPSIEKMLGYTEEETVGQGLFSLIYPDDVTELEKVWAQVLSSPGVPVKGYTGRLLHKNGDWRWIEAVATNMLHDPLINGIVDNFRDVTDRVELEEERMFDKKNLDALINNTPDLMWSVDTDFNLITSNRSFDGILNASGRLIKKGSSILSGAFSEEQSAWFKERYIRVFNGETFTETEHNSLPVEYWLEISFSPIRNGDKVIGSACYSRDITEKKKSEKRVIQSEASMNEAQAIAHLGNWEMNFETKEAIWSDEACKIYGLSSDDNIKRYSDWQSFIHPDDLKYVLAATDKARRTGGRITLNHRIVLKDGQIKDIQLKSKFKFNQQGTPTGLYGIVQDITDRKSAKEEREKMIHNIIQHSKNLEQFASIVSHNLRAPVANILGLANVLKTNITEADKIRSQQYLFKATEQLDDVLKDMVIILQARSEISEYKEVVDLNELVDVIKSSINNIIEEEKVEIVTDFKQVSKVTTIKSYIHSIFYNLISNSIKYRSPGVCAVIKIRSRIHKDKIKISFTDNGIGLDLELHGEKIFGLYQRFHLNIEGKGLGLFMVKTQIEALGGSITVESKERRGTEFLIELPA